jgi:hypothetical protein
MATRTLSTRWVTVIMVVALVCSVVVVWGLIQITGQSPASSSTPSAGGSSASASASASAPTSDESGSIASGAGSGPPPSAEPVATERVSNATETSPRTTATPAPILPGSDLQLPAAWTGVAEMTITVLGRCASTGGTSSYTRSADLALQGPVVGSGPFDDPNPLSLTLGITPSGIPGLSVYSASTEGSGAVRRTWWLTTGAGTGPAGDSRTLLSGVLIDDQPVRGVLPPNLLVDNETDLQPCEAGGTVRVPRTLATGSTLTGWVSAAQAHLDLSATTVDGERSVTAVVDLTRKPGP